MSVHVKVAGVWKAHPVSHVRVGGAWKRVIMPYVKINGAWKAVESVRWQIGGWSNCSAACGPGTQTRAVQCVESALNRVVPDAHCLRLGLAKPAASQACNLGECGPPKGCFWFVGSTCTSTPYRGYWENTNAALTNYQGNCYFVIRQNHGSYEEGIAGTGYDKCNIVMSRTHFNEEGITYYRHALKQTEQGGRFRYEFYSCVSPCSDITCNCT